MGEGSESSKPGNACLRMHGRQRDVEGESNIWPSPWIFEKIEEKNEVYQISVIKLQVFFFKKKSIVLSWMFWDDQQNETTAWTYVCKQIIGAPPPPLPEKKSQRHPWLYTYKIL
jgi:hypothetical protein